MSLSSQLNDISIFMSIPKPHPSLPCLVIFLNEKTTRLSNLSCIFFIFLFKGCFCLDPYYEACVLKDCGDGLNVAYPFYIQGLQDPTCAYPGFELQCNNNGSSVIQISGNDYLVKDIDYIRNSFRLENTPDITCFSQIKNLTLDPVRFQIHNAKNMELVFFMNCPKQLPSNLTSYRIGSCNSSIERLVMQKNDRNLQIGKETCRQVVVAPVELPGRKGEMVVNGGNYEDVMKRGFTM